jgi:DNA-binding Xre family transcriptional regulator
MPVADRVVATRIRKRWTRTHLAAASGFRLATILRMEFTGHALNHRSVKKLADAMGVDEASLYPGGQPAVFHRAIAVEMRRRFPRPESPAGDASP